MPYRFSANSDQLLFDARWSEAGEANSLFLYQNYEILLFKLVKGKQESKHQINQIIIIIFNKAAEIYLPPKMLS